MLSGLIVNGLPQGISSAAQAIRDQRLACEGEMNVNVPQTKSETTVSNGQQPHVILVVSARLENRSVLLRVFEGLNLNVLVCSTLVQAREVLANRPVALIFCDETLPDGTYRDLFDLRETELKTFRVVVTMTSGTWEGYLEAIRRGVFDVLQFPFTPTDVELSLIHSVREDGPRAAYRLNA